MSTLKTVGMAAAVLATGFLGYGIYKAMQDEDEQRCSSDDSADWDEMEDAEEGGTKEYSMMRRMMLSMDEGRFC
ncbi:hypothetical protein [Selenomonas sp. oral taxon 478]|uniref:hypothetical protein n=1 Tax=Selenomonas sp. oral taxon 478 TaxID=712538 RepID=UPI000679F8A1|nr:hypothetical protein [Selenomonas sp. oral taxon 478]AKT52959.1 hypothetical protein ADJ74_00010 [Selenomonas sp. oral taxon 478]